MPVEVKKIAGKYRLVAAGTRAVEKTQNNVSRDGGGHRSKATAERQASYINAAWKKKHAR